VAGETNGRDLWIAPDARNYDFADIGPHTIRAGDAEMQASDDIAIAGGGADRIIAGGGWDWVDGGAGNDTIFGGDRSDTIFGGAGDDLIYGGYQMDYLEGGAGADTITGLPVNRDLPPGPTPPITALPAKRPRTPPCGSIWAAARQAAATRPATG
jgi:hypothetical protein